jgi:deoxyadenosine/deoxycytidine kinase
MTPDLQLKKGPPNAIHPLIGVVGPCAAGKTTLTAGLNQLGYHTRHIAQEHSYVPDMWQRLTKPDLLVFLDASYPVTCLRRKLDWTEAEYAEQQRRLNHARLHADLLLDTDRMSIADVLKQVVDFLQERIPS